MKKLVLLIVAVVFTAISTNVFAQSTGTLPYIDATHQYWVNGAFGDDNGSTYKWWISTTPADLKTAIADPSGFVTVTGTGAAYNTAGEVNGIEFTWLPSAAGNTYYLVVEENDGTCTNIKAVAIQPVNSFDVTFAAVGTSGDTDNPERCAPDIALTASGTTISYDYGIGEYIYKITAVGISSEWAFNFDFTNSLDGASSDIGYSIDGSTYSTGESTSGSKTVSGSTTVYLKVTVTNGATTEGTSGQSMALELSNILVGGTTSPANIFMSDGSTLFSGGTVEQTQTVKARPATSGIQTN
nr:hypothetical protein [uncultured Draconibacterium sp.]